MLVLLNKPKPDLKLIFKSYIEERSRLEQERLQLIYTDDYDYDYDDTYGYDYYNYLDDYYGLSNKKSKHSRIGNTCVPNIIYPKNKKSNRGYTYPSNNNLRIYYYEDVNDPDNVRRFSKYKNFDKFINSFGIKIGDEALNVILHNNTIHCCIDPKSLSTGKLELLAERSFGALRWSCTDDGELE